MKTKKLELNKLIKITQSERDKLLSVCDVIAYEKQDRVKLKNYVWYLKIIPVKGKGNIGSIYCESKKTFDFRLWAAIAGDKINIRGGL